MEFPINGSFLAVCDTSIMVITDGSLYAQGSFIYNDNKHCLITPDSLVCRWSQTSQTNDTRIMIPKVASGIKYADAHHEIPGADSTPLALPYNNDHLYAIMGRYSRGYIINGSLTSIIQSDDISIKAENNMFTCKQTRYNYSYDLYFLDLGSMV